MPGFFEALSNMPVPEKKKHFVTVQGNKYEVSLEKCLWAIQHGEQNLIMQNGEIIVKPAPKPMTVYTVLEKAEKGYHFEQGDIHWPNEFSEGGVTWQIKSE
jgi:hypothetical protein|tara:strand:+ start:4060 stop:4362 length:303 start_codon:yes stop_codon:yes gene_type:complete